MINIKADDWNRFHNKNSQIRRLNDKTVIMGHCRTRKIQVVNSGIFKGK